MAQGAVHEKLWTPANVVTLLRICLVPVFVVAIISPWPEYFPFWADAEASKPWIAAGIFILLAATDGLDGYLARSRGEVTNFGKFIDPLADKILVAAALLALPQPAAESHLPQVFHRRILAVKRQIPGQIIQRSECLGKLAVPQSACRKLLLTRQHPEIIPAAAAHVVPVPERAVFPQRPAVILPAPLFRAGGRKYIPTVFIRYILAVQKIWIHPHLTGCQPQLAVRADLKKVKRE